jgi:hypothetical protein
MEEFEAYQLRCNLEGVERIVSNASNTADAEVLKMSAPQATLSTAQAFVGNALPILLKLPSKLFN